jgi:hypothetical protein
MSVDQLLGKLVGRTISAVRRAPGTHTAEVSLAKVLIETLGTYKAAHPELTDAMAVDAVRMVVKCIEENAGKID